MGCQWLFQRQIDLIPVQKAIHSVPNNSLVLILIYYENDQQITKSMARPLPTQLPSVTIAFATSLMRPNPIYKDSQWIHTRKPLKSLLSPSIQEVVLSLHGKVYEGLTSNLVAVRRHENSLILETAPLDSVLPGTILTSVIKTCLENGIPTAFQHPSIDTVDQWECAFITSVGKLVTPISDIYLNNQLLRSLSISHPFFSLPFILPMTSLKS